MDARRSSGCSTSATRRPQQRARADARTRSRSFPTYYVALDGMAQVQVGARPPRAPRSHYERARRRPRAAAAAGRPARRPLPRHRRRASRRRAQYALIGVIEKLLAANGVKNDLDIALFDADHGIALRARARRSRARATLDRPSVFGDDVLGWALARNGRCGEALALLEALAAARHAGRAQVLPPRLDRRVPRQPRRGAAAGTAARSRSTRASRSCGRPSPGRERSDEEARRPRRRSPPRCSRRSPRRRIRSATSRSTASRASRSSGHRLYVRYVLDLAEIPTFQARQQGVDAGVYARAARARPARHARRQARARSCPVAHALAFPHGRRRPAHDAARGDPARARASTAPSRSRVRDTNYADRIGWKEIVVGAQRDEPLATSCARIRRACCRARST